MIACPKCGAKLKSRNPPPVARPAVSTPKPVAARPAVPVALLDEHPERPLPRPKKSRKKKERSAVANGGIVVGLLLVFVALINVALKYAKGDRLENMKRAMNEEQVRNDEALRKGPRLNESAPPPINSPFTFNERPVPFDAARDYPELGLERKVDRGLRMHVATIPNPGGEPTVVHVYLPKVRGGDRSLPAVLVAPAGSNCLCGQSLGDGDSPEHTPYAREGFAVVAYSLAGPMPDNGSDAMLANSMRAYQRADAGLNDARHAIAFALKRVPEIDPDRLYAAGHSSAGTFALMLAANDSRIKGAAAYAACIDMEARMAPIIPLLKRVSGFNQFLAKVNPRAFETRLNCPVFLFHAEDDDNVPSSDSTSMEERLKKAGKDVTLITTQRGGHYQSMIDSGIPGAIRWMKSRAGLK